jgi:excisionase family DNA binding protein
MGTKTITGGLESLPATITIHQAAEALDLTPKTIRRYIASGRLKATRLGPRLIRVDKASLLTLHQPI